MKKKCGRCMEHKPHDAFAKGQGEFGLHTYCRACMKQYAADRWKNNHEARVKQLAKAAEWQRNNREKSNEYSRKYWSDKPEKRRAKGASWRLRNRDKANKLRAAWRLANLEKERAWKIRYRIEHPEQKRVTDAQRRARKRGALGKYTKADINSLLASQKRMCVACRKSIKDGYHVDHIVALINGGSNEKRNLQLLCPSCNIAKHAKHPIDFMQSRGYLL